VLKARIDRTVLAIGILKTAFSPAVAEIIDGLLLNANAIVQGRPVENALQARIEATRTGAAMDRLGAQFDKSFDRGLIERQRYRGYLFAYSILLLVLLAYFAAPAPQLPHHRRRQPRLTAANDTLEHRVAERTAELEAQSAKLERLAQHDSLTGLVNYGQLTRLLELALVRAARRDSVVVVMFIDLDGFKAVNDTWGHATGDLVLQLVAAASRKLRAEDIAGAPGRRRIRDPARRKWFPAGALRIAQLALDQIAASSRPTAHPVAISASIGISSARGPAGAERGAAALLADADQAMYAPSRPARTASFQRSARMRTGPAWY
jgi:diguanylate cyclase (GGDEF)-like protein